MPTLHAVGLLLFLVTLSKTTRTHTLDVGPYSSLSRPDPKTSRQAFAKAAMWDFPKWDDDDQGGDDDNNDDDDGRGSLAKELQSVSSRFQERLDQVPRLMVPVFKSLSRKSPHSRKGHRVLTNEIPGSSSKPSYPYYARSSLLSNVVSNIPVKAWPNADPRARFLDKLKKITIIREFLRLLAKKEREKLAFLKVAKNIRDKQTTLSRERGMKLTRRPMKFRRAKLFIHGKNHHRRGNGPARMKPSGTILNAPMMGEFNPNPALPIPAGRFVDSPLPPPADAPFMFPPPPPPKTMEYGRDQFRQKVEPPPLHDDDTSFVDSHWSSAEPLNSFSPSSFLHSSPSSSSSSSSFNSPSWSSNSDAFGFPIDNSPSKFSSPSFPSVPNADATFFEEEVPASVHDSSISKSSSLGFADFNDGFQSFPVALEPTTLGQIDSKQPKYQDGLPSGDTWTDGGFDLGGNDCSTIATKTCKSSLDCTCFGFYSCVESKCQSKQPEVEADPAASQSRMDGWHDQPVDFGFVKRDVRQFTGSFRHANTAAIRHGTRRANGRRYNRNNGALYHK